jgi:4a-hydroxytetrahydrobiopterin dehydratase
MSTLLDDRLVTDALHGLTDWTGDATKISRTIQCEDEDALLASVGEAADALDHHPEIERTGEGITFTLWTHSQGGVTELDIALASRIDDLLLAVCHKKRGALGDVHELGEQSTGRTVIAEPVYPDEPERYAGANPPTMNEPATPRQDAGPIVAPDPEPGSIEPQPGNAPAPGMHERVSRLRRRR